MPDSITPVGTMYAQQNPIAALSSIYGIQQQQLGIKQAQQNLQTGQYTQQSAQAGAQQDQMKSAQLQGATKLAQQAYTSGRYRNPDTGDFDSEKFANDVSALGPYAQQMANDITVRAGETYKNQQTLFNLDNSRKAEIANAYGALAAKENPTHADLADTNTNLILQHPDDPKFVRMITSIGQSVDPNANGQGLKQKALNFAQMAGAPSAMPTAGTVDTGGTIQPGTFAPPLQGGAFKPAGGSVQKTLAPNQQLPYVAASSNLQASGAARGGGSGNADINASNNVVAAQKDARANIDLTKRIDQLADIVSPGAVASKVSQGLGALGLQDVNQARTELQKDLGRLRGPLADRSASDDRARELLSGLPTDTTPTQTIHQAMDVQRGAAKQDLALGALRDKAAAATGGNMNGFQSQYSHAVGAANPLMHEYWSLPKEQQAQFLKRNSSSPQQAQELRNRYEAARSQLNVGQ
jgi:hypothetical protein